MTEETPLDALLADDSGNDERQRIEYAERRRVGIAAANAFLLTYIGEIAWGRELDDRTRGRLAAYEDVAVRICGLGTQFSAVGERDLSVRERAREFIREPELAFHGETPAARSLLETP